MVQRKSLNSKEYLRIVDDFTIEDPLAAIKLFISEHELSKNNEQHKKRVTKTLKNYSMLTSEQKTSISAYCAENIHDKDQNNLHFKDQLHAYCLLSGNEKNWIYSQKFINFLFKNLDSSVFFKKVCSYLFEITDEDLYSAKSENLLSASSLSFLVELGIQLAEHKFDDKIGSKNASHLIEFITSNFLARSNINNETIRIALVYYLSRVEPDHHLHLHKILSRFGQSLLEHVFIKYFSDKKKNRVAFYFLCEHLDEFLSGSASLAEMTHAVLQNQMLKNTLTFPIFINDYLEFVKNDLSKMKSMTVHISFLLKTACEVSQEGLTQEFLETLLSHINFFREKDFELFKDQFEFIEDILLSSKSKKVREIFDKNFSKLINQPYIKQDTKSQKQISKNFASLSNKPLHKIEIKSHFHPSPLDEILLLAS